MAGIAPPSRAGARSSSQASAEQMELPLGLTVASSVRAHRRADGVVELRSRPPQLEGTVRDACEALGGVDENLVYELIATGQIRAYKPNPLAKKGRWRVVMASVWALKERQLRGQPGGR